MTKISKQVTTLLIISFFPHLIWENAHAPLFAGYTKFTDHFSICLWATMGDILLTGFVYTIISLLKNNWNWITHLNKKDMIVLVIIGFFSAAAIEWRALLFDLWNYSDAMPIIPYLGLGISPVFQMIIILPLSFYLTKKMYQ